MLLTFSSPSSAFDSRKIISSSAESYVKSEEKNLSDYELIGVRVSVPINSMSSCREYLRNVLSVKTEAVADYRESMGLLSGSCYGTALIPRGRD